MRRAAIVALVATCFVVFPIRSWCSGPSPVHIPATGEPGWQITKNDTSQAAPSGYEGRTDTSTETAVGNTEATRGKRIVVNFKLGNQIRTCPLADGTAEGEGIFAVSLDSTNAQANGTNTIHIEMRANAKYKGQVGDSGYLEGPVNADVTYTYKQTGSFRDASGAVATPAGSNVQQQITIPFVVGKDLSPPSLGAFASGDPTKGHYAEARGVGMALTYWAGVYYSMAQVKWTHGQCVQIAFNPPSNSVQSAPGTETTLNAEAKTQAGQSVKAAFNGARARSGSVRPGAGYSNVGSPLKFTYTAPNQKVKNAGFTVHVTSRAGIADGDWETGLGSGRWTGTLTMVDTTVSTSSTEGDRGGRQTEKTETTQVTFNITDTLDEQAYGSTLQASLKGRINAKYSLLQTSAGYSIQTCGSIRDRKLSNTSRESASGSADAESMISLTVPSSGTYYILSSASTSNPVMKITGQVSSQEEAFRVGGGCNIGTKTSSQDFVPSEMHFGSLIKVVGQVDPRTPNELKGSMKEEEPPNTRTPGATIKHIKTTTWELIRH